MMSVIDNNKGAKRKIMGVPKEQATRNRQAIIDTASRIFRERGVDGVGVSDLMKAAGFTHGGFYNHFASKDALAAEACASAFACGAAHLEQELQASAGSRFAALGAFLDNYLSPEQFNTPGAGCPTATLAVDAARQGSDMQAAYASGIAAFIRAMTSYLLPEDGETTSGVKERETAIVLLANLVGSMVIARGVGAADPELSSEVLEAGRRHLALLLRG